MSAPTNTDYIAIQVAREQEEHKDSIIAGCSISFAVLFAIASDVILLIFGILAVIPAKPFHERNLGFGVTMIVLCTFGVMGLVGYLIGLIIGAIIGKLTSLCM